MDLGIQGKVAWIGGASRGLGLAVAAELAREGCRQALTARRAGPLEAAVGELAQAHGGDGVAVAGDFSDPDDVRRMAAGVRDALGAPEIVIANTGGPPSGTFDELESEQWQAAAHGNLFSVVELCREVVPAMKQRGWGRIVAITSISARQPIPALMLSNAMRAGVHGFVKTLADEVASSGLTVNLVCPGHTHTERLGELAAAAAERRGCSSDTIFRTWESANPMGRLGEPEELAAVVAFLCSVRASFVNGVAIGVDGGACRALP